MSGTAGEAGTEAGTGLQPGAEAGTAGLAGAGTEAGSNAEGGSQTQDHEKVAREKGWKPKEEFEGDPEMWVGAEEFVKRQPLYDKMRQQSKRIKELDKTVNALASHYKITIKQAQEQAIAQLKAERKEAIELGEVSRVDELDKQIETIKEQKPPIPEPGPPEEIVAFTEKHKEWFGIDKMMTRFAINFNESYLAENPGKMEESLAETERAVKAAFPEKFVNKRREAPPSVDGGGASGGKQGEGKYTLNRLSKEQRLVYDQLVVQHKQMKHEDYFKSLEEAGFLEG